MREVPVRMPKFSMAQEEGVLLEWHKHEGDAIEVGEVLCEVGTDKVDMDVESPVAGVVARLVVTPDDTVRVGEPIAIVLTDADELLDGLIGEGEDSSGGSAHVEAPAHDGDLGIERIADTVADLSDATPPSRLGSTPAVPVARRRAAEIGVDIRSITGTGRGGVVTLEDVETASAFGRDGSPQRPPSSRLPPAAEDAGTGKGDPPQVVPSAIPDPGYADALAGRRQIVRAAVARRMTQSAAVPQFTVFSEVDLEPLRMERGGISWTTLLIRAFAATLRDHPQLNALYGDHAAEKPRVVGVALAVDSPIGLLAPVLTDPAGGDLATLDADVCRMIDLARRGRLRPEHLDGATVTMSNLGGFGIHSFQALVTPPQVCALSVGAVAQRPVVRHGGLAIRTTCLVGLTIDHRVADGADAARMLSDLNALLGAPERLLAPGDPFR